MTSCLKRGPAPAALLAAAVFGLMAGAAGAEPAPPYLMLLQQSHERAPKLAESQAQVVRAEGLARQAAVRPNPTLGFQVENLAGSPPFNGLGRSETTASLAQPIELGGKRPARMAAGRASVEAARATSAKAWIDFAAELAQAYAEAEASGLRVDLAESALALAREDARAARALVDAGKESEVRVVQVEAAVQAAGAELEEARTLRATAFGRLTALSGSPAPYTELAGGLLDHGERIETWSPPDPLQSPAYLSASAEREAAARRVRVEQTKATPDVTLSVGVRRLAGDDATAMVGGVSLPFPVFDRNRGNVDAARAELSVAEARQRAALLEAEADARVLVTRLDSAQARVKAARDGEAAAAEAYRLTRLGYEGGKLPLLELLTARRALSEARAQSINALLERLRAEVELARLKGVTPFGEPA